MMNDDDFSHVTHGGSIFSYHEIPIQTKTTKKGYNPYSFEQSYYLIGYTQGNFTLATKIK